MLAFLQDIAGPAIPVALPIIILAILRKMKWVALLSSINSITYGITLSLICTYVVPTPWDANIPPAPLFYSSSAFIACFLCSLISSDSKSNHVSTEQNSPQKSFVLVLGVVTSIMAFAGAMVLIYAVRTPMPYCAAILFVIFSLLSSLFLGYAAKTGSANRPNLNRWIVSLYAGVPLPITGLVLALILIYLLPIEPRVSEPYAAAIAYLGTTTYTCLTINVASGYVSTE